MELALDYFVNFIEDLVVDKKLDFVLKELLKGNFKGSDRLCKVVELSMQCCGKLVSYSFETYLTS